jgi:5-methylcytosine-specific restriction protein A
VHASQAEQVRGNSAARGYDHRWRARRRVWLMGHPLCVNCEQRGIVKAATDVDHVVALSAGGANDEGNYQSLCHECHSIKTVREDGGFVGRAL